jgi:hypothetical protein
MVGGRRETRFADDGSLDWAFIRRLADMREQIAQLLNRR